MKVMSAFLAGINWLLKLFDDLHTHVYGAEEIYFVTGKFESQEAFEVGRFSDREEALSKASRFATDYPHCQVTFAGLEESFIVEPEETEAA